MSDWLPKLGRWNRNLGNCRTLRTTRPTGNTFPVAAFTLLRVGPRTRFRKMRFANQKPSYYARSRFDWFAPQHSI